MPTTRRVVAERASAQSNEVRTLAVALQSADPENGVDAYMRKLDELFAAVAKVPALRMALVFENIHQVGTVVMQDGVIIEGEVGKRFRIAEMLGPRR